MMPVEGNRVKILKGAFAGESGTVKHVDESRESPLYVISDQKEEGVSVFGIRLTPDEVEIIPPVSETRTGSTLVAGDRVRVIDGPHAGKSGKVLAVFPNSSRVALNLGENNIARIASRSLVLEEAGPGNPIDRYPIADWRYAVANGFTYLGYTAWQDGQVEADKEDE